jgi:hypothetical protein
MKKLLLSLAAVALLLLCACAPKPSNTDIENGLTQAVQVRAMRMNPFASAADTKIVSWKITNQYTRDKLLVYEFEVKAHLVAKLLGNGSQTDQTLTIAVAFQKNGDRWDSSPLD